MIRKESFHFCTFSNKQMQILRWWREKSPYHDYDGIIADGAIRSGKTLSMSLSFVMWAMDSFDAQQFGLCGKSIGSLRRNVINGLVKILPILGYRVQDKRSENCLVITWQGKLNHFAGHYSGYHIGRNSVRRSRTDAGILCQSSDVPMLRRRCQTLVQL